MPTGKSKKKEDKSAKKTKEDTSKQTQSKEKPQGEEQEKLQGEEQQKPQGEEQQKPQGEEQQKPQGKEEEQHSKEEQKPETSTGDTQEEAKDEAPKNQAVDGLYQLVGRPQFFGRNKDPKYHFVKHDEAMGARYRISLNEGPDNLHLSEDEMSYISAPVLEYDYHVVLHANGKYFVHRPVISD